MTTINKLSEQIMRLLEAGTKSVDSKLSKQVIALEIRQAIHAVMRGEMRQATIDGEKTVDSHYVGTFSRTVLEDSKGRNYITLPSYVYLYGHQGIQQISPLTDRGEDRPMIPIMPNEMFLFDQLTAGKETLRNQWCYELKKDKAIFSKKDDETLIDEGITSVEVEAVSIDPDDVGNSDTLPLPPELEMMVIKEVLSLHGYSGNEIADMVLDGNPNIRQ